MDMYLQHKILFSCKYRSREPRKLCLSSKVWNSGNPNLIECCSSENVIECCSSRLVHGECYWIEDYLSPFIQSETQKRMVMKPTWLEGLMEESYCGICGVHENIRKNEKNIFCLDCCQRFCPHCLPTHNSHPLLQLYFQRIWVATRMKVLLMKVCGHRSSEYWGLRFNKSMRIFRDLKTYKF